MITKYASFDVAEILDIKGSPTQRREASLNRVSDFDAYRTSDGYMYVRLRAISSRTNKNHDGWPTIELAGSPELLSKHTSAEGQGFTIEASQGNKEFGFATFPGRPIFVDHNNGDPKRTRGVIRDSKFRVLDKKEAALDPYWSSSEVDAEHLPASEVELLLEIDAKAFPRLAADILNGDLDGFSMGADVERSKCSHCGHIATNPDEYCSHVRMKGAHHDFKTADGKRTSKKSYENCYGIKFFEISAVFDPADETAVLKDVTAKTKQAELYGDPRLWDSFKDPMRGNEDFEIERLVMEYMNKGVDENTAREMATRKVQSESPMVPNGEGATYQPLRRDYAPSDNNGMPGPGGLQGFPPPVRMNTEEAVPGGFLGDANNALNEQWPERPMQNDFRWSKTKTAENELPQSMHTHAPDEVDTLRDERTCPICGNDMEGETCDVCGYVEPPKGFDNPDLSQAEKIRGEMKQLEEASSEPNGSVGEESPDGQPAQGQPGQPGQGPLTSQIPSKPPATASVTNEMTWTPLVTQKEAARINKIEQPVQPPTTPVTNEPTTQVVMSDQTRPVTSAMLTAQRLMATAQRNHTGESMSTHTADATSPGDTAPTTRVDVTGIGGVDQASNDAASKADAQVDVTGIGGTGVSDVDADKTESLPTASESSNDSGFNTDKTTEDSGPTATYGDSDGTERGFTEPVTSNPFPASEDGVKAAAAYYTALAAAQEQFRTSSVNPDTATHQYYLAVTKAQSAYDAAKLSYDEKSLEQNEQQGNKPASGGSATKGVQPSDPIGTKDVDRVDVLQSTTTPSNNSGDTKTWSGTDGNGVLRQQEPVTHEPQQTGEVRTPDVKLHTGKAHFMNCLKLAETEVELGLVEHEAKFNRIAELDAQSSETVTAKLEALAGVKTAGLAKLAQQRQSGVRRLPSAFGKATAAPNGFERVASDHVAAEQPAISDEMLDSALFTR